MYDISQTDIVAKQRKQVVSNAKSNQPHVEEQKNVVVNPSYQSSNLNKSGESRTELWLQAIQENRD